MKFILFLIAILYGISDVYSQKTLEKEWEASGIKRLEIKSNEAYEISIRSEARTTIAVRLKIEGETAESMVLKEHKTGGILHLETAYSPFFQPFNDKLAAHKVLAMELEILVPETMQVTIQGVIASVTGEGSYDSLTIFLQNGYCTLQHFLGNGIIETKRGAISVQAKRGVTGRATSKYGTVLNQLPQQGILSISARSDFGDITLTRSQ